MLLLLLLLGARCKCVTRVLLPLWRAAVARECDRRGARVAANAIELIAPKVREAHSYMQLLCCSPEIGRQTATQNDIST
jgi:hypothetical protein